MDSWLIVYATQVLVLIFTDIHLHDLDLESTLFGELFSNRFPLEPRCYSNRIVFMASSSYYMCEYLGFRPQYAVVALVEERDS